MPQDVAEAAFVLAASYRYFPEETIFTCVIDPGVGTDRAILCMRSNGQVFLAPDNGLLSVIADESGTVSCRMNDKLPEGNWGKAYIEITTLSGDSLDAALAAVEEALKGVAWLKW